MPKAALIANRAQPALSLAERVVAIATLVLILTCAAAQAAPGESIARSCVSIASPVQEHGGAERGVRRACRCAAQDVRAAWPAEKLTAFDQQFAAHAEATQQFFSSATVGSILSGRQGAAPAPSEELRSDLVAFGERLEACVARLRLPPIQF